ncbi:MAG TPA: LysM domain-containing protein [Casimicrobiaceae bacterium]|nr:LysM domain-containing protein [Casimicrobiaceae bacterium]
MASMMPLTSVIGFRHVALALAVPMLMAACASPPPTAPAASSEPRAAPAATAPAGAGQPSATAPAVATPALPQAPAIDPAIAKPQAQKLALEAVDQLQTGDEAAAKATLERALALDAGNELARKLSDQIRADAQKELGNVFFRYTVQKDDTLSKLAQQYLGDRYRFYLLAKYNDIGNPSRLAAGQVIRLPGRGPLPPVATASAPATLDAPAVRPPEPEAKPAPRDDMAELMAKAAGLEKAGNVEGAYLAYADVLQRSPNHAEAIKRRDATRTTLVRTYDREAMQAFQRQNLDLAISKWERVLEIDPGNRKARLERDRAVDLKTRMQAKFGTK